MALVIVIDDSPEVCNLMRLVLAKEGHEVLAAQDGAAGLSLVKLHQPDLVVSDVKMPGMTGFELVSALRRDPDLALTPVILMTALQERTSMRAGMNAGADDYITKPFTPKELSEAVAAQLDKMEIRERQQQRAVGNLVTARTERLANLYEQRLQQELLRRWPTRGDGSQADQRFESATALFVDIVEYPALAARLNADELSDLAKRFYGGAGDTMYLFGARHMHFSGEGLLVLFTGDSDTRSVTHVQRAVRSAFGVQDTAAAIRRFLEQKYPDRHLPEFRVATGLYTGPLTLAKVQDPISDTPAQTIPVGEAVGLAVRLQMEAAERGWSIVACCDIVDSLGDTAGAGACARLDIPGRADGLQVCEVLRKNH